MIIQCPSCSARARLDKNRHAGRKLKIRCPACGEAIRVDVPAAERKAAPSHSGPRVLVAHADPALCKTIGSVVEDAGMQFRQSHDGDSALTVLEEWKPHVMVVDVALPGLYAFEVVERVRMLEGLEHVGIILLSSVYNKTAYKRRPSDLYGADDYIEQHHIPDDLVPKIRALLEGREAPAARSPGSAAEKQEWDDVNRQIQQAEEHRLESGEEMERARQLARIIASDIALYHHDKLEKVRAGEDLADCFRAEIDEAARLFLERFPGREDLADGLVIEVLQDLVGGRLNRI
ncbi:MAG: response regulator [Geothermobacteraceae bacterium]